MHAAQLGLADLPADARQIDRLAPGHSGATGGARKQSAPARLHRSGHQRVGGRQQLEGHRLQRVAGQQGHRLAKLHMDCRLATAQHIVVHARHVVVYQRIGVYQFGRACGTQRQLGVAANRLAGSQHQQGSQPLATVEHRVAHRLHQLGPRTLLVFAAGV